ncbi:MAG: hypothetical protein Tsb009_09350 [Planctomycetaceae bacterium]
MFIIRKRNLKFDTTSLTDLQNAHARRGVALMVVMVTLSITVVLTLAFLRSQTTSLQIQQNTSRREFALQAARTGAAVALREIHLPEWQGISTPLNGTVHQDLSGTSSYHVEFLPLSENDISPLPADSALHLVLKSTGRWTNAEDSNDVVERTVKVIVRLRPRLAGRNIVPGDSAAASDLNPNPGDYDVIQQYALFAEGGAESLVLDPGDRIEGKIWLHDNLRLYKDPHWNFEVRAEMLASIGTKLVANSQYLHPHPLGGEITFYKEPSSDVQTDLQSLKTRFQQTTTHPYAPKINLADWTKYQLYAGGPTYTATKVETYLRDVTLRPTAENPLGIFYTTGSMTLDDNVVIQGTLVSTGQISISGENVRLCAFNWRGETGSHLVADGSLWPRLPAVVAKNISVDRSIRTSIEGAVIVSETLNGAGGNYELFITLTDANLTGKATSQPLGQPWSLVRLETEVDLSGITENGKYEIWLADGNSGSWHTIVKVDRLHRELTVLGEVEHETATNFRIRRGRVRFIDIRGPVCGKTFNINRPLAWDTPTKNQWSDLRNNWKADQKVNPGILFMDWLAKPSNWSPLIWSYPHIIYGLPLEPTFHAKHTSGIHYRWSPPLFRAFPGKNGDETTDGGYRWQVVSWRVVQ